jgi:hypothetical protein
VRVRLEEVQRLVVVGDAGEAVRRQRRRRRAAAEDHLVDDRRERPEE